MNICFSKSEANIQISNKFDLLHKRILEWLSRYKKIYLWLLLISWSAKHQHTLSRFSVETDYRGVANVVFKSCWLRNLLLELYCPVTKATLVYFDNTCVFYLSDNTVQQQRTKHIEMDIHFVHEKVAHAQVHVHHIVFRLLTYLRRKLCCNSLMTFEIISTFAHLWFQLRGCIRIIIVKKLGPKGTCILCNLDLNDHAPQETINVNNM